MYDDIRRYSLSGLPRDLQKRKREGKSYLNEIRKFLMKFHIERAMRKYLEDIVITSILDEEDFILIGSELTDPYRLVFIKMNKAGDIITKKRFGSGPKDYEGHDIHETQDGYVICGCSEGIASGIGGEDWKAYVLEVDSSGNKIRDRSVMVNGNECFYS